MGMGEKPKTHAGLVDVSVDSVARLGEIAQKQEWWEVVRMARDENERREESWQKLFD